jgi:MFS family permease
MHKRTPSQKLGQFHYWNTTTIGIILGAFFYGYVVTQLPGGWMAQKYGGRALLGLGVASTALLTLLTPPVALMGRVPLILLRVVEGLAEVNNNNNNNTHIHT